MQFEIRDISGRAWAAAKTRDTASVVAQALRAHNRSVDFSVHDAWATNTNPGTTYDIYED